MVTGIRSNVRQRGLTLVELMVAVAVLGIALTIAVPSFSGMIAASRVSGPANEALSAMHFARSEAIRLNRNIEVCKSNAAGVACDNASGKWPGLLVMQPANSGTAVLLRQIMFDSALTVNGTHPVLRFNAEGFIRSTSNSAISGTLRLCITSAQLSDNTRDITYVSGGRASVSKKAVSGCGAP